jgi:hypothetical protein
MHATRGLPRVPPTRRRRRDGPPAYGLLRLGQTPDDMSEEESRPWANPNGAGRPFPFTRPWVWEDGEPSDKGTREQLADGTLHLGTDGCAQYWLLVVAAPNAATFGCSRTSASPHGAAPALPAIVRGLARRREGLVGVTARKNGRVHIERPGEAGEPRVAPDASVRTTNKKSATHAGRPYRKLSPRRFERPTSSLSGSNEFH